VQKAGCAMPAIVGADEVSGAGSAEREEEVPPEFECSICLKLLLEPVTVSCGHTFCRRCLEESLGYRGACAVCRAPIVSGQSVNILVRSIISERFPITLCRRIQDEKTEIMSLENAADDERKREAMGSSGGALADAPTAGRGGSAWPSIPILGTHEVSYAEAGLLPHCPVEWEPKSEAHAELLRQALQGGSRVGVIDGTLSTDDGVRTLGVCFKIEAVEGTSVRMMGKFRFWLVDQNDTADGGFKVGRIEPFFDLPLAPSQLVLRARRAHAHAGDEDEEPTTADRACELAEHLQAHFEGVGHGGRFIFSSRFGDLPTLPSGSSPATSASLERLSFFFLAAFVTPATDSHKYLASVDTHERLLYCLSRFKAGAPRPVLNLPGARSWMGPGQSALKSLALLIAIIALIVCKALGLFEQRGFSRNYHDGHFHGNNLGEAVTFGQLFR